MTVTYTWTVENMVTNPQEGSLIDVVVFVNWRRVGQTLANDIIYTANQFGCMACETPSSTDFTAYPDLTYLQVCGWLNEGLDVPTIDNAIYQNLELDIYPPTVILPNPWEIPQV